tara:strand:+ start:100 stop:741 length:642 start_codon:yes stop_codon:yes gene_type:complete
MMNRFIFIIALIINFIFIQGAFSQENNKKALQILDKMSNLYKSMDSFSSTFEYSMVNLDEDIEDSFQGKITIKEEKYLLKIEGQEIINDGETVWTYIPELNEVNISTFEYDDQEISLNNVFDLYKDGFEQNYLSEDNKYHKIELYPEDESKSYYKILILINKVDFSMYNFSVFDKSNTKYVYKINEFKEEKIDDSFFIFDSSKYPDIEIIDFR